MSALESMETFFVRLVDDAPGDAAEAVADQIAVLGGLILMATKGGSLVVALPREAKDAVLDHPLVALVGGVTLSEDGGAAKALRQRFALNAARQLAQQGVLPVSPPSAGDPSVGQIGRISLPSLSPRPERSSS